MEDGLLSDLKDNRMTEDISANSQYIYSGQKIKAVLDDLNRKYQIVRLVDPDECRTLIFNSEGDLEYGNSCFSVWGTRSRCSHCTRFRSCKSNGECDRRERINGQVWKIRSVPVRIRLKDGSYYSCTMELINPEKGSSADNADIENNANNEEYLLFHDVLTGLYNEDGMRRRIRTELIKNRDTDYVLVLTDVRRFSFINDLFGTNTGNNVLMEIARLLKEYAGENGVCSRIRGDQFVLFVPAEQFDEQAFIQKMRDAEKMIDQPNYHLHIHAAAFRVDGDRRNLPVSVMVDRARLALERIKTNQQVNLVWFQDNMLDKTLQEQRVISSFPSDLRNGEFTIYLQPQVDSRGNIIGAEALVRRVKQDGTVILPGEFIPVLEKSDLILKLDLYVWELVAKTLASWKGTELQNCCISINVSPRDAYYVDVPETLTGLCSRYGIATKLMHVEITESGLMKNLENHIEIIDELHRRGFFVEIDDFGKGASSLGILRNVDADQVKLDMSFLKDTGNETKRDVILSSVIDMTKRLGMDVLMEGVETVGQKKALEAMGCLRYQGYYFSKAVPVPQFEENYKKAMKIGGS